MKHKLVQQLTAEMLANHAALGCALVEAAAERPESDCPRWVTTFASIALLVAGGADPVAPMQSTVEHDSASHGQMRRPAMD
ncbi:hypothetical protein [Collimonas sp.]|uniref:hypothetical protein n=1 Tax=Collimonas sp. TaxID=1963772 RepID=UPI002BD35AB0|nr:hypothetical protein [Collimonas sp.]HWW99610.1 hypothetical protein [Collimonas sp.]